MCPNTMEINGVKYVAADSAEGKATFGEWRIVVLQRGWVLVGRYKPVVGTTLIRLYDSSVVRKWGTSKGLGELAETGGSSNTILDKNGGYVEYDILTQVFSVKANQEVWEKKWNAQ